MNQKLEQLLFSEYHQEDNESSIQNVSSLRNHVQTLIDDDAEQFLENHPEEQPDEEGKFSLQEGQEFKFHFPTVNGPSVEFSQNSMMLNSKRHDESESLILKNYRTILEDKKKEEKQVEEVVEQEITSLMQEIQKKDFEIEKRDNLIEGFKLQIAKKDKEIQSLEKISEETKNSLKKADDRIQSLYALLTKKDKTFSEYQQQFKQVFKEKGEKEQIIEMLTAKAQDLEQSLYHLQEHFGVHANTDQGLYDFKGTSYKPEKETSLQLQRQRSNHQQKQIQKLRSKITNLQTELIMEKSKNEEKEGKGRTLEDEYRKKLKHRDNKVGELQEKIASLKEEYDKMKTKLQANLDSVKDSLSFKIRQLKDKSEKLSECEKRIKNHVEEFKKKEEKIRDLNVQVVEKNKQLQDLNKEIEDMKVKQSFDHHCIQEKEDQIHQLNELSKTLKQEMTYLERQFNDKNSDSTTKLKRQLEKTRKQAQNHRKRMEMLEGQVDINHKQKIEREAIFKEMRRKTEDLQKKLKEAKDENHRIREQISKKEDESPQYIQQIRKNQKELTELRSIFKKKQEENHQLRNKLIIMEKHIQKLSEQPCSDEEQEFNACHRIQALEQRLEEKEKQIRHLKSIKSNHSSSLTAEDMEMLEERLNEKEAENEALWNELQQKQAEIQKLEMELRKKEEDIDFQEKSLNFMHQKIIQLEGQKLSLVTEKKLLEESFYDGNSNCEQEMDENTQFYENKIHSLQQKIHQLKQKLKIKEDRLSNLASSEMRVKESEYKIEELKRQVKQVKKLALKNDHKLTPESLSKEDTIEFLMKVLKRASKSTEMLRLLSRNEDIISALERLLNKLEDN